jgi:hypothetical protein
MKNDDLVRIKVLFPENAVLFQVPQKGKDKTRVRNNTSGGLDLYVRIMEINSKYSTSSRN